MGTRRKGEDMDGIDGKLLHELSLALFDAAADRTEENEFRATCALCAFLETVPEEKRELVKAVLPAVAEFAARESARMFDGMQR